MIDLKAGSQFATHSVTLIADHLAGLNPKQREAVEYGIKLGKSKGIGPSLVIAGAGSGKTKTLAHRVAHLIINGADPNRILLRPAFVRLVGRLRKANNWPAEFEPLVTWYEPPLPRLYDDADTRSADIAQLQQIAAGYRSRERFLTELSLDPPEKTSGDARAAEWTKTIPLYRLSIGPRVASGKLCEC